MVSISDFKIFRRLPSVFFSFSVDVNQSDFKSRSIRLFTASLFFNACERKSKRGKHEAPRGGGSAPSTVKFAKDVPFQVYECIKAACLAEQGGGLLAKTTKHVEEIKFNNVFDLKNIFSWNWLTSMASV